MEGACAKEEWGHPIFERDWPGSSLATVNGCVSSSAGLAKELGQYASFTCQLPPNCTEIRGFAGYYVVPAFSSPNARQPLGPSCKSGKRRSHATLGRESRRMMPHPVRSRAAKKRKRLVRQTEVFPHGRRGDRTCTATGRPPERQQSDQSWDGCDTRNWLQRPDRCCADYFRRTSRNFATARYRCPFGEHLRSSPGSDTSRAACVSFVIKEGTVRSWGGKGGCGLAICLTIDSYRQRLSADSN